MKLLLLIPILNLIMLNTIEFLNIPNSNIALNIQTSNLSRMLNGNDANQGTGMSTNFVNEMVDIGVPDEEIVFETSRKQQDKLFMESQTCDPCH